MTHTLRSHDFVTGTSDSTVGAGRMAFSTVVVHVHAGSPPPPRQVVAGIAAPPVARA